MDQQSLNFEELYENLCGVLQRTRVAYLVSCLDAYAHSTLQVSPKIDHAITILWSFTSFRDLSKWEDLMLSRLPESPSQIMQWQNGSTGISSLRKNEADKLYNSIRSIANFARTNLYAQGNEKTFRDALSDVLTTMSKLNIPFQPVERFLDITDGEDDAWGNPIPQCRFLPDALSDGSNELALLRGQLCSKSLKDQELAAYSLQAFHDVGPDICADLQGAFNEASMEVKMAVLYSLGETQIAENCYSLLESALTSEKLELRVGAVKALGKLDPDKYAARIIAVAFNDHDTPVRRSALEIIMENNFCSTHRIELQRRIDDLEKIAMEKDPNTSSTALWIFSNICTDPERLDSVLKSAFRVNDQFLVVYQNIVLEPAIYDRLARHRVEIFKRILEYYGKVKNPESLLVLSNIAQAGNWHPEFLPLVQQLTSHGDSRVQQLATRSLRRDR